ncbi:MAG: hypothetical protein ACLSAH_08305 [Bilophila wadsworthia]
MGAQMVRVASKTNDIAGDGTTTATVLAQAIYREGVKLVPPAATHGISAASTRPLKPFQELGNIAKPPAIRKKSRSAPFPPTPTPPSATSSPGDGQGRQEGVITVEETRAGNRWTSSA